MRRSLRCVVGSLVASVMLSSSVNAFFFGDSDNPGCAHRDLTGTWEMRDDNAFWRFHSDGGITCEGSCIYNDAGFSGEPIGYDLPYPGTDIQVQTSDGDFETMTCTIVRGRVMKIHTIGVFDKISD
jgi:hypothetical protein